MVPIIQLTNQEKAKLIWYKIFLINGQFSAFWLTCQKIAQMIIFFG